MRRPDPASLVAGLGLLILGGLLLADRLGALDLRFAALAPLACALVGAILLASGLDRRD
jgi:hypothetical protein